MKPFWLIPLLIVAFVAVEVWAIGYTVFLVLDEVFHA